MRKESTEHISSTHIGENPSEPLDEYTCPINSEGCRGDPCPLRLKLDDWEGCALDIADQGIAIAGDMLKKLARVLDRITSGGK